MVGNKLYLPGRIEGNGVSFLVDTGSGVSILAAQTWMKWGRAEDELTRYWGRLCSVEGRALECLGSTRLTMTLGTRAIKSSFIVAEIGDDEGILGNNFASSQCGRARVLCISCTSLEWEKDTWASACRAPSAQSPR